MNEHVNLCDQTQDVNFQVFDVHAVLSYIAQFLFSMNKRLIWGLNEQTSICFY